MAQKPAKRIIIIKHVFVRYQLGCPGAYRVGLSGPALFFNIEKYSESSWVGYQVRT